MTEATTPATASAVVTPHIQAVRQHLLDTLAELRRKDQPMEVDRARAVAQVAAVLVDTAKVEVDYIKATGQAQSTFLEEAPDPSVAQLGNTPTGQVARWPGVTQHKLK
jgi:hypothetical protein